MSQVQQTSVNFNVQELMESIVLCCIALCLVKVKAILIIKVLNFNVQKSMEPIVLCCAMLYCTVLVAVKAILTIHKWSKSCKFTKLWCSTVRYNNLHWSTVAANNWQIKKLHWKPVKYSRVHAYQFIGVCQDNLRNFTQTMLKVIEQQQSLLDLDAAN